LQALVADPRHEVLVANLTDSFGSHGSIGVLLLARHPRAWHLRLLATSCRVVSFGVGTVLLSWLADQAARADVHLIADFLRTDRNRIMEVAYRFAGFNEQDCACWPDIGAGPDRVQRLHMVPGRRRPPTTMRLLAPDLAHPPTI
jgi:methoxymalonate biosynthesis protein